MTCKNCTHKFNYKKVLKSLFIDSNNFLKCENCQTLYEISRLYRFLISILISLPIFLLLLPKYSSLLDLGEWIYLKIFLTYNVYIGVIVLFTPLFVPLKKIN